MSEVTLLTGAVWGIVGAIVMMVIMQLGPGDSPPPFAVFWAKFIGNGNPDDTMPAALILHFIYAAGVGAVYTIVVGIVNLGLDPTAIVGGLVLGVSYSLGVFVVGAVGWVNGVLGMDPERSDVMQFAVVHIAFGVTLGVLGGAVPHLL